MSPLLIDGRDLFKFGLITVLTTAFVFAGGVFYGYQRASSFYLAGNDIKPLLLPAKATEVVQAREPQVPDSIVAGEDIDVDQPDKEPGSNEPGRKEPVRKQPGNSAEQPVGGQIAGKIDTIEPATVKPAVVKPVAVKSAPDKHFTDKKQDDVATVKPVKLADAPQAKPQSTGEFKDVTSLSSEEVSSIKYSVQVGMYGRLSNAESMVKQLQSQQLDAYVSDFTNKKNETRYNVRFGYYQDKKSAVSALKSYRQSQKGDGYLVRFSADDIMNLAKNKQPASVESTDKKPLVIEEFGAADKVSLVDDLNVKSVLNPSEPVTATN